MQIKVWNQDTDKFCLAVGKDAGYLVFFIVELYQSVGNDLLVLSVRESGLLKYLDIVVLEK